MAMQIDPGWNRIRRPAYSNELQHFGRKLLVVCDCRRSSAARWFTIPTNPAVGRYIPWCSLFNNNSAQGSPLELQQIANSDPTDQTCGTNGANCIPGGDSGDLRVWLPFAYQSRHLNVLELYSVDADLAFDPQFCVLVAGNCDTGSYTSLNGLSTGQQLKYFQPDGIDPKSGVGLGNTNLCYTGTGLQTLAQGDCSYRDAINLAHGYH
jgi:hypothetical protein